MIGIKTKIAERSVLQDMATIHYGKFVQNSLKDNQIDFIKWSENAPVVPQTRPIKKFWSSCKRYHSKWSTEPNGIISFRQI